MGDDIAAGAHRPPSRFLNTLPDAVDMTLVDFDTEVRVARFTQHDFPRLVERIRSRKPQGVTAMYDALGVYLDGAAEAEGRTRPGALHRRRRHAQRASPSQGRHARCCAPPTSRSTRSASSSTSRRALGCEQRLRLTQIAEESGGEAIFPLSMKEIERPTTASSPASARQYTLGYVSTNTARDGRWRKVEVRVRRDGLRGARDLRVLTRKGYFAPFRR